jgi:hypothetical protein
MLLSERSHAADGCIHLSMHEREEIVAARQLRVVPNKLGDSLICRTPQRRGAILSA